MKMLLTLSAQYTESYMLITVPADIIAQNDKAVLEIEEIANMASWHKYYNRIWKILLISTAVLWLQI